MNGGYLLDTNVLSAMAPDRNPQPPPEKLRVRTWVREHEAALFLPVTAIAEIAAGIGAREASGATRHARDLAIWLSGLLGSYPERVLPLDAEAALHARSLAARARMAGVTPSFADLSIACIASTRRLVVATRNLRDFQPLGVAAVDPFAG